MSAVDQVKQAMVLAGRVRFAGHVAAWRRSPQRDAIEADLQRRMDVVHFAGTQGAAMIHFLTFVPEWRSQLSFRLGPVGKALAVTAPGERTLFFGIDAERVGPGLFIQHGFATIITAQEIGPDCWINQQVTIGHTTSGRGPILEGGVVVTAGAKVLGPVTVGARAVVGANAVVVKDVPPDSVVAGVPAQVIRHAGRVVSPPQPL